MPETTFNAAVDPIMDCDGIVPAFQDDNIPVFLGCDGRYFHHAITVVASIAANASPESNYDILIIQDGAAKEKLRRALDWSENLPNVSLRFIDGGMFMKIVPGDGFHVSRHITSAAYFRIFAPAVFGNYDRILYLDSDVVCLGDVAELYRCDLGECAIGACHDLVNEQQSLVDDAVGGYWRRELGKTPGESYCNSGVLVMDLARMRGMNAMAAMLEKMRSIRNTMFHDQDVLNAVFNGKVRYVDCKWNLQDWMTDKNERAPLFGYLGRDGLAQIRNARSDCRIIHFTHNRPWNANYLGENEHLYWRYAAETPFYGELASAFGAECRRRMPACGYLVTLLQTVNFWMRFCLAPAWKKRRYRERMGWVSLKRRRFRNLMSRFGPLGRSGKGDI